MIVKLQFEDKNGPCERTQLGDNVIRAIDKVLNGASWEKSGNMSSSDRDRIESVTQELNDALAEIGRPFGFRLAQAMLTYADMYPSHAPDRVNRAIADQIEMRILPKLRGLELDDRGVRALVQIQTILEKTNDKELCEAVELANDQEVGRFHWLGVSREA